MITIMKTNKIFMLLLAAAVFTFTACEKEIKRPDSPVAPTTSAAFKASAVEVDINPMKVDLAYEVALVRSNTAEALTVGIEVVEGDADIFVVPATAAFAKDAAETSLKLTFPTAQLDSSYSIVIAIKNDNQNPYIDGSSKFSLKVNIASWEASAKPAVFVDGVVCSPFGLTPIAWYVNFQEKSNADGSKDFRFINPYRANKGSQDADDFGVYSWFVYNSGEDVDMNNTYNWEIHVDAAGNATFPKTYLGPDYGYGPALIWMLADFYAAKQGTDPDYATYGIGSYVAAADAIIFPAGSYLWYFDGYGGNLASLPQIIYLNSKQYQDDHLSIADYNDPSIEWVEQESEVNFFESSIFNFSNEDQKLFKAKDPYAGNPKSPFINLYCLKDAYAEGANLAFYWDGEDGDIEIPEGQNTKLTFMKQELFIAEGEGTVVTKDVKGTAVKVFTFDIAVANKAGDLLGEYTETFSMADKTIVFEKSDFIGTFVMADAEGKEAVEIKEVDGELVILGFTYADSIFCDFDAETGALSIAPQLLDSLFGAYDVTLYTIVGESLSAKASVEIAFGLSGIAKVTATSEASGFVLYSKVAGGAINGMENFTLTPAAPAAAAPAKAPAINGVREYKGSVRTGSKPSVNHLSIKGKYQRSIRSEIEF